ncbi:MAG: hypothetical protein ABJN22_02625 [Litorimonas sp.]
MSKSDPIAPEPESIPQNPIPKRSPINWERAIAALALALSVTAILVSLLEVSTVRAHVKATVWPHLALDTDSGPDGTAIQLRNKGVGPALVEDIFMKLDGELVTDIETAIVDSIGSTDILGDNGYKLIDVANQVIAAGETVDILSVGNSDGANALMRDWTGKLDIQVCYCSIQEDCWTTYLIAKATVSADQCDRAATTDALQVSERDFSSILGDGWTGTLSYKDYSSGEKSVIPVNTSVEKINARTIVYRLEYPKETDYNSTERLRISRDGTRVDGAQIIKRERVNNRLEITIRTRSTDNKVPANIEITYKLGRNQFDIVQRVLPDDGGAPFIRNQYSFKR